MQPSTQAKEPTFKDDLKNLSDSMTMIQECVEAMLEMPVTTSEAIDHLDKDLVWLKASISRVYRHILKAQAQSANRSS